MLVTNITLFRDMMLNIYPNSITNLFIDKILIKYVIGYCYCDKVFFQPSLEKSSPTHYMITHKIIHAYSLNNTHNSLNISYD